MAAPSKLTQETVNRLLTASRAGLPYRLAAEAAGISESTFHAWQRGEFPRGSDKALKSQFLEELTRARGESALRLTGMIYKAAPDDWRAAAWILERRFPKDFGKDGEALQRLDALEELLEQWRASGSPPIRIHEREAS